jgi:hypothetical protein
VFFGELVARTSRVRAAEPQESGRSVEVSITWQGSVAQGLLVVSGAEGSNTRREVTGSDCAEVVSALALVAALVIDPRASSDPIAPTVPTASPPENQPSAAPEPAPVVPEPPPAQPGTATAAVAPRPAITPPDRVRQAPSAAPRGPGHRQLLVGADGHGLLGPAPDPAFGAGAFVGLDDTRSRVFAVAGRVAVFAVTSSETFEGGVGARFTWVLLRPELCPLRLPSVEPLRLELCPFFDVGLLNTQGKGLQRNDQSARLWLAPGAAARASLELGKGLLTEVSGGVAVPLRRYPFAYERGGSSAVEVHTVSFVEATLSMGMGYRFP